MQLPTKLGSPTNGNPRSVLLIAVSYTTYIMIRLPTLLFLVVLASPIVCGQINERTLERVRTYYETARRYEQSGNWIEAEKSWREALSLAADDARAWTNLGVTLNRQNRESEALEAWNRAIALDSKLVGPYFNMGLLLVRKADFAGAVSPLRRALSIEPNHEGARRALALALIGTQKFPEATREIAKLLSRAPEDSALLEMAATTFLQQRRYKEAATVLQRRLRLTNTTGMLWAQYGDALDGAARTPEAADAYRKAVELDPASTVFRYGLGYLYWKMYQYGDAERELTEVLRRDAKDARVAFTLGDLYLTKGDAQRSLPFLETAAAAYPNEFDTRFALGRALVVSGDVRRGVEELRAAVRLNDSIADGHYQLGRALRQIGLTDEAKLELERARELQEKRRSDEGERLRRKLP